MAAATWNIETLSDVDVAEAYGMCLGLIFATELGSTKLHAETDSLNVVTAM